MIAKETILKFIKNFQNEGTVKTFTEGCCYWFAHTLYSWCEFHEEKPQHRMMYNQIDGHFACEINGELFDITGQIERTKEWEPWIDWCLKEPVYRETVVRDCILKTND